MAYLRARFQTGKRLSLIHIYYMDEAVLSDRVVVMDNGEILTQG